jgi:membrane protease YdiL (CAAX protease family)
MDAGLAMPALALFLPLLVVLAVAWRQPVRRALVLAFIATLLLYLAVRALPELLFDERPLGEHWNWTGELLALAGVLLLARQLVRSADFSWREFGLTCAQRAGSLRPGLLVAGGVLAANYVLMSFSRFRISAVPLETWLYQASLPGLVEETVFRGVLLALADRVFVPRWSPGGASFGWGAVLVTWVFVALHGFSAHTLTGVLPAALLYLWLRVFTGSLVLPIVAHNAWNLSVYLAHL